MKADLPPFARRIRELRDDHELTQAEFGAELGLTQSYISACELGNLQPTLARLVRICDTFKVSADWLLGRD